VFGASSRLFSRSFATGPQTRESQTGRRQNRAKVIRQRPSFQQEIAQHAERADGKSRGSFGFS